MMNTPVWASVLCALLLPNHGAKALCPPVSTMAKVPARTISLGSTGEELLQTANWKNRLLGESDARAEDFNHELQGAKLTYVPAFYMDRFEVSVEEYVRCSEAGRCPHVTQTLPHSTTKNPLLLPVTEVTFEEALLFCEFRGARLPTEAEFESAARGQNARRFPWGEHFHSRVVNGGSEAPEETDGRDGFQTLAPTHAFPHGQTPEGIFQLAGNAAEWTSSAYGPHGDSAVSETLTTKGGDFATPPWLLRGAARVPVSKDSRKVTLGFRCARSENAAQASPQ